MSKKKLIPAESRSLSRPLSPSVSTLIGGAWILVAAYLYGFDRLSAIITSNLGLPLGLLFDHLEPSLFFRQSLSLLWLAFIFGTAALGGRLLIRRFQFSGLDLHEELLFGLGLGLGLFSLLTFSLGLAGLLEPIIIHIAFITTGVLMFFIYLWHPIPKGAAVKRFLPQGEISFSLGLAETLIAFLILINLIGALGPPIFYDTLVYHFGLPQLYLIHHKIFPTPHNVYSGIPMNTEMLYTLGLALGGEGVAKLIPWGVSIVLLYAIIVWTRRFANGKIGLFAALLFYSCPMIAIQTWFSLVELMWCFFGFLAVFAFILALEQSENSDREWFALTGTFTGLAVGVKYNAMALAVIFLAILFWKRISMQKRIRGNVIYFTIGFLLAALPWFLKNAFFYHNPIFPFLNELFTHVSNGPDWHGLLNDAHARDFKTTFSTLAGFKDLLWGLWSPEWEGTGVNSIGIALLLFIPWLFLMRWKSLPHYHHLFLIFVLSWLSWDISSRFPRFFLFALPFAAILLSTSLLSEKENQKKISLVIIMVCGFNCLQIFNYWFRLGGWKVVLCGQSESEYLQHGQVGYFTPYYAAAEFANSELPRDSKLLFLGESRGYYFKRDFIATSYFAQDPFAAQVDRSKTPEELRDYLKAEGVTHLFVNRAELFRRGDQLPFSNEGKAIFFAFLKSHLRRVFQRVVTSPPNPMQDRQWVEVYEII